MKYLVWTQTVLKDVPMRIHAIVRRVKVVHQFCVRLVDLSNVL